jgi:hypothetical protein
MKAFPHEEWLDSTDPKVLNPIRHPGMDLRDYFAAQAVNGFVINGKSSRADLIALRAYEIADAMMEARNGNQ